MLMNAEQNRDVKKTKHNPYRKFIVVNLILAGSFFIASKLLFGGEYSIFGALLASWCVIDTFFQVRDYREYEKYGRTLSGEERRNPPSRLEDSERRGR